MIDYEKIADIIRDAREARHLGRLETVLRLQRNLSDYLAREDVTFDERAFEVRCMSRGASPVPLSPSQQAIYEQKRDEFLTWLDEEGAL